MHGTNPVLISFGEQEPNAKYASNVDGELAWLYEFVVFQRKNLLQGLGASGHDPRIVEQVGIVDQTIVGDCIDPVLLGHTGWLVEDAPEVAKDQRAVRGLGQMP